MAMDIDEWVRIQRKREQRRIWIKRLEVAGEYLDKFVKIYMKLMGPGLKFYASGQAEKVRKRIIFWGVIGFMIYSFIRYGFH